MSKFKVGDWVRVTDPLGADGHLDEVGVVNADLQDGWYQIVFGESHYVPMYESALTLAPSAAEPVALVEFTFHVNGTAAPQGSKKAFQRGKKIVLVEMSKNLPAWRTLVTRAAMRAWNRPALDSPVSVQVTFRIPKPKSTKFTDYPAGPPDTDKLQRAVGDALQEAGVLSNDSRIVHWDAAKVWGPAGATITVTEMRAT